MVPERHLRDTSALLTLLEDEAGGKINMAPPKIALPDGGLFQPDLVITEEQEASHFVEVERDVDKNLAQRQAKWRNFYQASGGRMFVMCDNRSCMRTIRSEINYYLKNKQRVVSITNLADLKGGKRGEGDSFWLEARNRG